MSLKVAWRLLVWNVFSVVAHVKDPDVRNGWVIFDQSGNQAQAVFAES